MALSSYIKSITEMNNLTQQMRNMDEVTRYSKSDIYWATKKMIPICSRKITKGDLYQFEFGKNFVPEMSYEHRGLVIGVAGKLLYVLPICSYNSLILEHVAAYHPIDNINTKSNYYLLKAIEFSFLKHDSVLKLNDLKTISINRLMYANGNINMNTATYKEIERMAFGKCFPTYSFEFDKLKCDNDGLNQQLLQKDNDIAMLNNIIKELQDKVAATIEKI